MRATTAGSKVQIGAGRLGRGVFATVDIAAEETIEVCPTLEVHEDDASGTLNDYVFRSAYDEHAVILMLGYGMLYNHSFEANAEYVEHEGDDIAFVALRDIEAGEEVLIDYGSEWWDTRERTPD